MKRVDVGRFVVVAVVLAAAWALPVGADDGAGKAGRGGAGGGAAAGALAGVRITHEFANAPLTDVVGYLRSASGAAIVFSPRVSQRFRPEQMKVSMRLAGVPLGEALTRILAPRHLALLVGGDELEIVPEDEAEEAADTAQIYEGLNARRISLNFTEAPLADLIAFVREFTQMNIVIDQHVWAKYKPEELRVTIKLESVPFGSALKLILEPRGLMVTYDENVLMIVPKEDEEKKLVAELYDVRDLMYTVPDFPGRDISLVPAAEGGGGLAGADLGAAPAAGPLNDPQQFADLVKKGTGGDTWQRIPGTAISISNGLLTVVQSRKVHRQIVLLLARLREMK